MRNWYEYDITDLNESVFNESGWDDEDNVGDAPDIDDDDTEESGWGESAENDNGQIDSDYCDDEVDPNATPQYRTDKCTFSTDPPAEKGVSSIVKDDEGTEEVEFESAFEDEFDWDSIF